MQSKTIIADSYIEKIGNRAGVYSLYSSFTRSGEAVDSRWHYRIVEIASMNNIILIKLLSLIPWFNSNVVSFYYRNCVGCTLFVHDFTDELTYSQGKSLSTLVRIFRKCYSILLARKLIFITSNCYRDFETYHPVLSRLSTTKSKLILHNCASAEFYDCDSKSVISHSGKLSCIYYGRILAYKNLDACLERLSNVGNGEEIEVRILTPDLDEAHLLKSRYARPGFSVKISRPQEIEYLIDLIRSSHVVLYPSLQEGFGIPLIESILIGKWILISRYLNVAHELPFENQIFLEDIEGSDLQNLYSEPSISSDTLNRLIEEKNRWAIKISEFSNG